MDVVAQNLLLDSQRLQISGHLDESGEVSPELLNLDDSVGSSVLGLDDLRHHVVIGLEGVLQSHLDHDHGLDALGVGLLPPGDHGLAKLVVLEQGEVLGHLASSILVEVVLPGDKSDSLEHLHSEGLPSNGSNRVTSILLLLDVVSPDDEDVASLVNVLVVVDSPDQSVEGSFKVVTELLLQSDLIGHLLSQVFRLLLMLSLFDIPALLQLPSLGFLEFNHFHHLVFSAGKVPLLPGSEGTGKASSVPVKDSLSDEASLLGLLRDHVEPLEEASGLLSGVHSDDEVAHDSVSLRLHLRNQVLLLRLVLLDLDSEELNLILVVLLPLVQLVDVVQEHLLPRLGAHLLPNGEAFVLVLLVDRVGHPEDEPLGKNHLVLEELDALEDVVRHGTISHRDEPVDSFEDAVFSVHESDFKLILVEVIPHLASHHDLLSEVSGILNLDDVVSGGDPLLEALLLHQAIEHVPDSAELVVSALKRPGDHGLLSIVLAVESVLQVLRLVHEVLSGLGEHLELPLVTGLLPLVERLRLVLLVQIHESQLNSGDGVVVVLDSASPFSEASVQHVLVPLEGLFEQGYFVLLVRHLHKLVLLPLELLSDRDLLFQLHSGGLKLVVYV